MLEPKLTCHPVGTSPSQEKTLDELLSEEDFGPREGQSPTGHELEQFFLPFRGFCTRNKVHCKEVVLHDLDVASALVEFIKINSITTIVLGAPTRGAIAKAFKNPDIPTTLTKIVPEFCSVYVASKDKVDLVKASTQLPPLPKDLGSRLPMQPFMQSRDPYRQETWHCADSEVIEDDGGSPVSSMTSVNNVRGKNISFSSSSNNQSPESMVARVRFQGSQSYSPKQSMNPNELFHTFSKRYGKPIPSKPDSLGSSPAQSMTYNEFLQTFNKAGISPKPASLSYSPAQSMISNEFMQTPNKRGSHQMSCKPGCLSSSLGQSITGNEFLQIYNKRGNQIMSNNKPISQSYSPGKHMTANEFLQTCNKPGGLSNINNQINTRYSPLQSATSTSVSGPPSWGSDICSFQMDEYGAEDATTPSLVTGSPDEELRRLRIELKQTMEMYNAARNEAIVAKMKVQNIDQWKPKLAKKKSLGEISEETALARVEMEERNSKAAIEVSQVAQRLAELVAQKQKTEKARIQKEAEKNKSKEKNIKPKDIQYRRYSIEEIESATNNFSSEKKVGEGGYGPVYKGYLDHTLAAIKVLRKDMSDGKKQFDKEVEVLSSMRHPHLVLLLGACPENGCLAYEYLENGSLEDRLFCKDNTPPLPWRTRFKIAAEIASGLFFLHHARTEPLVHRDLKPGNILLDGNYVSKIGDVGLSRLVPASNDGNSQYCLTAAAGTFCYIDPEYQQSGKLGTKSDIYSFGVILLQLLTAKPPMGLTYHIENAIETGKFEDILDPSVKDWPVQEALSLAKLGLKCCELRKKDRPDLHLEILPQLVRLRDL